MREQFKRMLILFAVFLFIAAPLGTATAIAGGNRGGDGNNGGGNGGGDNGGGNSPGNPNPGPPDNPGNPGQPGNPNPGQPENPGNPNPPDNPNNPQPGNPNQPENPGNPDPGQPGNPEDPNPGQPDNPGSPENPGNPNPSDPNNPPNNPGNPNPGPPDNPGQPDNPGNPNPPSNPDPGPPDDPGNGKARGHDRNGGGGGGHLSKEDRKALREARLNSIREKLKANRNKSHDNLKDLLLQIPFTDESPYSLKLQSLEKIKSLEGLGEDNHKLSGIIELMDKSLNESLWLDERHILSSEVMKHDMHAAQKIRVLMDREKKSSLVVEELTYALIKLVQADMMLAYIAIDDMEDLLDRLPEGMREEFEGHLQEAVAQFTMAQTHIEAGLDVVAIQKFNNAWQHSYGFMLEKDKATTPNITITSPANNTYTNTSRQLIAGSIFDIFLHLINVTITVNGVVYSARLQDGEFSAEVELIEGLNVIEVSAVDFFGNKGSAQVAITLDTIPPEIKIEGIEEGAYYNRDVSASISVFDANLLDARYTLDGEPYTPGTPIAAEGAHVVSAYAVDKAGNSASKSVSFTIDKTPPEVSIASPPQGAYLRQRVSINGSAEDINLDFVSLRIDEKEVSNAPRYDWDTLGYADGNHTITLEAFDKAGNSASVSVDVIVDNTPPQITITEPDKFYVRQNITIDAEIVEVNLERVSVRVDGDEASTSLPYLLETALYPDGNHTIEIYAFDKAGNYDGKGVVINIDNTPPVVNIASPLDGSFAKRSVDITGSVSDVNLLLYYLAIDDVNVSNLLPYTWNTLGYADGNHTLKLTAVDRAGNLAFEIVTVTVDNTPPRVEIRFPPDGAFVRGVVEIILDVFDLFLDRFSLFINGVLVSENQASFNWNTSAYDDGAYVIELVATDKAGNVNRTSVNVTVDNTPPVVNITSPADGSFVRRNVTVDASVVEANLASLAVRIDEGEVSASLPYAWDTLSYPDGVHVVRVLVSDKSGNSASDTSTVTVDNTLPVVEILAPLDGSYVSGLVAINFTIYDANLHDYIVTVNGTALSYPIIALYPKPVVPAPWNTTLFEDGSYLVEVTAFDRANNSASDSVMVAVDNTGPELVVNELTPNPTLKYPAYSINGTTEPDATVTVNGVAVPLVEGVFSYTLNVSEGTNIITVVATDMVGNPTVASITRLVDADNLPDWYEVNVTGTDPLDADSDSSFTAENEADNGITDDLETFGESELPSVISMRIGSDPFKEDTDGDGLRDEFELLRLGLLTNVSSAYTNGASDASSDLDGDGLTNLEEQGHGTDPLVADTDKDGVSDRDEASAGTNPLAKDSDGDGLDDDGERRLGTNPNNPDSDGDGVPDGSESYSGQRIVGKVGAVIIEGVGDVSKTTIVADASGFIALAEVPGGIGSVVNAETTSSYTHARIEIPYDEASLGGIPEGNLRMYYYDNNTHSVQLLPVQGVDTAENYVWAEVTHLSYFGLYDYNAYVSIWNSGSNPTTPEFSAGDTIRIKANVRNIGAGSASNVKVEFREERQTGTLIGTTTIASISAGGSALTSIEWTVKAGVSQVCVNVDPSNLIVEVSEENNRACKGLSKVVDSDGDGLTDYDENNGMRTSIGDIIIKTDPNDPDSDDDKLTDGEEMGMRYSDKYYLNSNPTKIDSDGDGLDDFEEFDFGTDALNRDSDGDGIIDSIDTDPLVKDIAEPAPIVLEIARDIVLGAAFGEAGIEGGNLNWLVGDMASSPYYLVGWIGFSLVPVIGAAADARDALQAFIKGDELGAALNAAGVFSGLGDAIKVSGGVGTFVTKYPSKVSDVAKILAKHVLKYVPDSVIKATLKAIYKTGEIEALLNKGVNIKVIREAIEKGIDPKDLSYATKLGDQLRYLTKERWAHIFGRHIDGSIKPNAYTSFFPTGNKIPADVKRTEFTLPKTMDDADVETLIFETIEKGTPKSIWNGNGIEYTFNPGKQGISELVVQVYKSSGEIATAFPVRGSAVWVWDEFAWVNKV